MQESPPTLINVLGAGGAGTTLLGLMLGNSEEGFACGEARVWFRPWRPGHFNPSCWCGERPCPVWESIGGFPEDDFHRRIVDRIGARVVTDSSKWLDWVRDTSGWAQQRSMAVVSVLIWKHPFDLCYTWWRRGRLGTDDQGAPPTGEKMRAKAMEEISRRFSGYYGMLLESDLSPLAVSYDRLVDAPADTLAALCGAAGVSYTPGQELFWQKRHHTLFGNDAVHQTLRDDEPELKRTAPSPKYLAASDGLADLIESDSGAQRTLEMLREASVNGAD